MIINKDSAFDPFAYSGSRVLPIREDGGPWVSWVKHRDSYGWCAPGRITEPMGSTPIELVMSVFLEYEETALDRVHCCGDGVLSLGPLGATVSSGEAISALGRCQEAHRSIFNSIMQPVWDAAGVTVERGRLRDVSRDVELSTWRSKNHAVRLGSDSISWGSKGRGKVQKERARIWVSSMATLLGDERVQRVFVGEWVGALLRQVTAPDSIWPRAGEIWTLTPPALVRVAALLAVGYRRPDIASYVRGKSKSKTGDLGVLTDEALGVWAPADVEKFSRDLERAYTIGEEKIL